MKRKILSKLTEWKNDSSKKPLIVFGARQIGKTYSIDEFAKNNYLTNRYVYINFEKNPSLKDLFKDDLSPETIINNMKRNIYFKDVDFTKDTSNPMIFFFDEVQQCGRALTSLKFFKTESEYYHVICSGSLLGISLKRDFNNDTNNDYPVGYVDHYQMYNMDFEEFMWALGYNQSFINNIVDSINNGIKLDSNTHEELNKIFMDYLVVGGMPEAVQLFSNTKDYHKVRNTLINLKQAYEMDINKYIHENILKVKTMNCFNSVPNQLKQQKKKFKYNVVESKGRASQFRGALEWLFDSGIVIKVNNIKQMNYPIDYYKIDDYFKLFIFDTGILMSMFEEEYIYDIFSKVANPEIGGILENGIAGILIKKSSNNILYYYDDNVHEIDFVIEKHHNIYAIEIKSGDDIKSKSINYFIKNQINPDLKYIRLSYKQVDKNDSEIIDYPLYYFALKN